MPRVLTIDNVQLARVQLLREPNGELQVYVEYHLRAGGQVVQTLHQNVTAKLGATRKSGAAALIDALQADLALLEGV